MVLSSALRSYESMLVHNATRVSSIESSLRSLSWFLPGRFQDSELASEALYSALNVLGLYHDSIVMKTVSVLPAPLRPPSSSHARYTRHYTSTNKPYAWFARTLQTLNYLELLLEMATRKRRGRDSAEKMVIGIEAMKAILRLGILKQTEGRSGVQPPITEREIDPSVLDLHRPHVIGHPPHARISFEATSSHPRSAADVLLGKQGENSSELALMGNQPSATFDDEFEVKDYWTGSRTGVVKPTIASIRNESAESLIVGGSKSKDSVKQFLMSRVLTVEDVRRPQDLVNKTHGLARLAEIIWILRPLIYVLSMRKYGRRHTLPYLLSLALEYLSYSLRQSSAARTSLNKAHGPMLPHTPTEVEKQETKKRANAFWWYLLRGPVWDSWTRPQLEAVSKTLSTKPVISFLSTFIGDYIPLIDEYYFYTS